MFVLMFAESGGVQIVPDLSIFVHMAMILIMIWILNRTFFKPPADVFTGLEAGVEGLTLGRLPDTELDQVEADVRAAFEESLRVFESNGARIVEATLPVSQLDMVELAMQIIGATYVDTLDTKGTDGSNVHLGGPETITGYFGGIGQPNEYALKWLDEYLYYYTNYGVRQVLNINPGTVLLGYMLQIFHVK